MQSSVTINSKKINTIELTPLSHFSSYFEEPQHLTLGS
jgi:hypothetical protein